MVPMLKYVKRLEKRTSSSLVLKLTRLQGSGKKELRERYANIDVVSFSGNFNNSYRIFMLHYTIITKSILAEVRVSVKVYTGMMNIAFWIV